MRVLVVNAGSSSLKLRVLDGAEPVMTADIPADRNGFDASEVSRALTGVAVDAVGHRVVHGGTRFTEPMRLDADVVAALRDLNGLAPLHQPKSLAGIDIVSRILPGVPAVACFDTAFHAGIPAAAATYAIPLEWRERWPVRRFGFHGLSHAYAARRAVELCGDEAADRLVTCHLGAGASLAAVRGGRSVDTTMGFTPLEGIVMGTRSGTVDPGLVLWLQEQAGLSAAEVAETLEHRSGLLGLAGTTDMQVVLDRVRAGESRACLALDVYLHRLSAGIAAMTAALGGLDAVVFTGGVGEHAPLIRSRVTERLSHLGLAIDSARNTRAVDGDDDITASGAPCRTLVIAAREDLEIARGVRSVLGAQPGEAANSAQAGERPQARRS